MDHPSEIVNTKGHPFVGVQWPVIGSKGDVYTVIMFDGGFHCNCVARTKCKHIKSVEARFEDGR